MSASTPGRFYINSPAGSLYYVPRAGENLVSAAVTYPAVQTLLSISGASNVKFQGVGFMEAGWTAPDVGGMGLLDRQSNSYYAPGGGYATVPSAVNVLAGCSGVSFVSCVFQHLGADGLFSAAGCDSTKVSGCAFSDISGSAIDVTTFPSDARIDTVGVRINSNTIHDVGTEYQSSAGMNIIYTDGASIDHNVLYNLPYTGITLGLGWGGDLPNQRRNNVVAHNVIHDFMQLLSDGGGIYTNSNDPGEQVSGNVCYNLRRVSPSDPPGMYASCYYLDDGSAGKTVFNNVGYAVNGQWAHFNDNKGPNLFQYNFFDAGQYFEGIGTQFAAPNVYQGNANVGTALPQSILNAAGLDPGYGGKHSLPSRVTMPQFVAAQRGVGGHIAVLHWTAPAAGTARFYEIWRDTLLIGTAASTSYTDTTVLPGSRYVFRIDAVDAFGEVSRRSNAAALSF